MKIGCVVLASGESVRFGSNKLLADFDGKPVLAQLFEALPTGLETVVVTRSEAVQTLAQAYGLACIVHELPEVCDTIRLGLEALEDTAGCLFCVGDQPLLSRETICRVVEAFQKEPLAIVRAAFEGRHGNPVLFPAALYQELMTLNENEAGMAVIRRHVNCVRTIEAAFADELADADTPGTLERLLQVHRNHMQ